MTIKGHMPVAFAGKDLDKNHISIPTLKENTKGKKIEPFDFDAAIYIKSIFFQTIGLIF